MGIGPAIFSSAGQRSEHYVPGAYSRSASIVSGGGGVSAGNGVIMGRSTGGKPQTLLEFSTLAEAAEVLYDGELLNAVAHAFFPGGDYAPQKIQAMVVNPSTQSARILKSGANEEIRVKSVNYGTPMNQIKLRFTAGTNPGTHKVTIQYQDQEEVIDNIRRQSFTLSYIGDGSNAVVDIDNNSFKVTVSGEPGDSLDLAFEDFKTIDELVTRINTNPAYNAIQIEAEPNVPSNQLDAVTGGDIKTSALTLKSDFYALLSALESSYFIGRGNAEKISLAANKVPDYDDDFIYFQGAIAGTYNVGNWTDALKQLEAEDVQIISTPSTDNAVHTLIANHCIAMSNIQNRKERTAFVGGPLGETVEEALEKAKAFGVKNVSYCYPSIIASSPITGESETLAASYFACKCLGMETCVAVNEPLTWKSVKVLAFYKKLRTTEMEKLIKGGVLCGGTTDDNRLAIIRAMTTFQGNVLQECERSMVREDFYMNRDLRQRYSRGVGRPGIGKGGSEEEVLKQASLDWKGEGMIVPADGGDLYWGLIIRKDGDKTYITFNRNLTAPQNFFFITANNYVYVSQPTTVAA
ncbi:hypothetical protein FACS189447_03350 [Spirochaetia bacterium]|nr:hypothetical protein FACS189447_03350 [Spirochaetia bacterium]